MRCPRVDLQPLSHPAAEKKSRHFFFGYYDKTPWDAAGRRILAHRTTFLDRFPNPEGRTDVGFFSTDGTGKYMKLAETTAWNWQQGSQLQWLPDNDGGGQRVMFNDRRENRLVSVILNPDNGKAQTVDSSIYTLHPSGRTALTLNYARLFDMRMDYGISGLADSWRDVLCPSDDGIYSVDLNTGHRSLIVSILQVAAIQPNPLGEYAKHWVNHMMFNPSGRRFCFLHRFNRPDGITHSRLFSADSDGRNLRLLFEGMVSHYSWRDDTTILAWAGKRSILGGSSHRSSALASRLRRCLKPVYYAMGKPRILMQKIMRDSFYLVEDSEQAMAERFAYGKLTSDGHCTFSPDRTWVLTDGYTDRQNRLPLFLYSTQTEEVIEIGRFPTPRELDGPIRVDLHPRFNADGTKVCIDSAMDGTRQMYVIDVSGITRN